MTSGLHHKQTTTDGIHTIVAYIYANASARTSASGFTIEDLYKVAFQQDTQQFWSLVAIDPIWIQFGSGSVGPGSGDSSASYLVLNATSSLGAERVLTVSGSSGLILTDNGPNSTANLAINDNIVATISGATFTGVVSASAGLSGSLQYVGPGLPYLLSQGSITITTQSNGQIIISGSGGGSSTSSGADVSASYVTIGNTGSLPNERVLTAGTGLVLTDNGANSTVIFAINNNVVATVSGTTFIGVVSASAGLSGSLQYVGPGLPYLLSQGGISITTQSNGQIIISGSTAGGAPPVAGTGILINGSTISINDNVAATLTGSVFSGPVNVSAAGLTGSITGSQGRFNKLSGSLTQLESGVSYLIGLGSVTVTSASNGQIFISGSGTGGSTNPAGSDRQIQFNNVSSFGASAGLWIDTNNVLFVSGGVVTPQVTGSITKNAAGLSYLVGAGGINILSQSNNQVVISSSVFSSSDHARLRQLIHLAENGPYELLGTGSTFTIGPQPFPTSSIWRTIDGNKLVEKTWVRNSNQMPTTITWKVYDVDGSTILATAVDTISYQNGFESSRIRNIT